MYLYKKNEKSIIVYDFVPDKNALIEFKKKQMEHIKSVILHINNPVTEKLVLNSSYIMFHALDRREDNGRVSYIKETKNDKTISKYINGDFDSIDPTTLIGCVPTHLSYYSGGLYDQDSTLLFMGGSYQNQEFISTEGILLTGCLKYLQALLSNDITNLFSASIIKNTDFAEKDEFLKLFSCTKKRVISLDNLQFLQDNYLIYTSEDFEDILEKSTTVFNGYQKVKSKNKNNEQ